MAQGNKKYMERLIDREVSKVFLNDTKNRIVFYCEDFAQWEETYFHFYTFGDCCSTSYIYHIDNLENIFGLVLSVKSSLFGEKEKTSYGNVVKTYHVDISTKKGTCTIDFRNTSNGCYGGELIWSETAICSTNAIVNCRYIEYLKILDMKQIREDF